MLPGWPRTLQGPLWERFLDRVWHSLEHFLADALGWSRANAFAENLVEPLLANDLAQNICSIQPLRHRAECGACHLGSARCPCGTQSACEGACTYLSFCTSLPALTFLHFPFCTYSCTSFPALPFLHLLSCTLSWSGVPPGVKFPSEYAPCFRDFLLEGDFPHEGGSFPGVGSRKELSFLLK